MSEQRDDFVEIRADFCQVCGRPIQAISGSTAGGPITAIPCGHEVEATPVPA